MSNHRLRSTVSLVAALLAAAVLPSSPTVRAQTAAEPPKEEIVTLSRFDVRESTDNSFGIANATAGLKSTQPLIEIPSAIQVLPRVLIDSLGFNWLTQDYARFVASGLNSYGGNNQFYLRGQRVTPMFKNGIQYYSSVDDALTVETVEVVKGVNASLFGSLPAVSGMVMESTKIPLHTQRNSLTLIGATDSSIYRAELDSTGPLAKSATGPKISYRLLAAYQKGDMKQLQNDDRVVISPSIQFDWKTTTLRLRYEYSDIKDFGLYTNNFLDEKNEPSVFGGRDTTYKAPWSWSTFKKSELEANLITRFSPDVEGRLQIAYYQEIRADHDNRAFLVSTPTGGSLSSNVIIPVNAATTMAATVLDLAQTQQTVSINDDYVANFKALGVSQQLNFGLGANYLYNSQGLVQPVIGRFTLGNPVLPADPGAQPIPGSATTINDTRVGYLYGQDQLKFLDDRLIATVGLNWGFNEVITHKPIGAAAVYSEAKGSDLTNKTALVWKFTPKTALFGSRATAFVPQGPGVVGADGRPLPAITSTAYEAGLKADGLLDGKVTGSFAYFKSETVNQPIGVNPGTANFYNINGGSTKTDGLEFDLTFRPAAGWEFIATAFQGSGVVSSATNDYTNRSFKETHSLLAKYNFTTGSLKGLVIGGNLFHMGSIYLRPAPALPAWTTYSAFASYVFGKSQISVNVENFTDVVYGAGGNNRYAVTLGAPRTLRLSYKYKF